MIRDYGDMDTCFPEMNHHGSHETFRKLQSFCGCPRDENAIAWAGT